MKPPTPAQFEAIKARGNVLLEAGAGSGKTSTLVARCLDRVLDGRHPVSLDEILMVTFTEAAAAEMRQRIREELGRRAAVEPAHQRLHEQIALLDQAPIGTLHGFCLRLIREHFHELGLDPQSQVLDAGEARLLAEETVRELFDEHFHGADAAESPVLELIRQYGDGDDTPIQRQVQIVHHFLQTLPQPARWLERQEEFWNTFDALAWTCLLLAEISERRPGWQEQLDEQPAGNLVAHRCAAWLRALPASPTREQAAGVLRQLADQRAEEHWPRGTKGKFREPIIDVLDDATALASFAGPTPSGDDPLAEDFRLAQPQVLALLGLVREFGERFAVRKRQRAGLDFNDLEQFALRLLWDDAAGQPSAIGRAWRQRLGEVLVDEYQDINEAQNRIIAALSREGAAANRFLVGDVKQSIYGFRLARPDIFLRYADLWHGEAAAGRVLPLTENFRSHEAILEFVNRCFGQLLRPEIGGIGYPEAAHLRFGDPTGRRSLSRAGDPQARVELCLRVTRPGRRASGGDGENGETGDEAGEAEQSNAEHEAHNVACRLAELRAAGEPVYDRQLCQLRPVEWRDMAVLLRATAGKADIYARAFARAGVPLVARRGGFFAAIEVADLVNCLQLLDNPRQDLPLLAVLRSPLVGLSPDELVAVRMAAPRAPDFWTALRRFHELADDEAGPAHRKVHRFLTLLDRWRELARRGSLSQCLEEVLDATQYLAWLDAQPRGREQSENVQRLLELARHYDAWQGRGLHRFLEYIRLADADTDGPEPAAPTAANAVQLLTIHASKGLEFPIVALADLQKPFRRDAPLAGFGLEESLGFCPEIRDEARGRSYPSLALVRATRLADRRAHAEEIRLLYVAFTRACDRLLLFGTTPESRPAKDWAIPSEGSLSQRKILGARSLLDLIGPLIPGLCEKADWAAVSCGVARLIKWRVVTEDDEPASPCPAAEPAPPEDRLVVVGPGLPQRVTFQYPWLDATRTAGKTTVTRVRRQLADLAETETGKFGERPSGRTRASATQRPSRDGISAAAAGIAHHTFLQHVELERATDLDLLEGERQRLVVAGILSGAEAAALRLEHIQRFWSSDVGGAIRGRPVQIHRELEFTAAFTREELAALGGLPATTDPSNRDQVIVQGIVDLAVLGPAEIWLLDFKTDRLAPADVAAGTRTYEPQLELYRRALTRTFQRPVPRVWLHFLQPGTTVELGASVRP